MKHSLQRFLGIFVLLVTHGFNFFWPSPVWARVPAYLEKDIESISLEQKKIKIKLVFPKQNLGWEKNLEAKTRAAIRAVEEKLGMGLQDSLSIFFDPMPDRHNGLTTVVPSQRITVHLEPPFREDSTGIYQDYLLETLTHELAHMVVMQNREGVFSFLSAIFGTSSRPLGLWPRWMHEGLAVWVESHWGGRPHSGYIQYDFRKLQKHFKETQVFPVDTTNIDGQRALRAIEPGHLPYHFGFLLIDEISNRLAQKNKKWSDLLRSNAKSLGVSYRVVLREDFGIDLDEVFQAVQLKVAGPPSDFAVAPGTEFAKNEYIEGPFLSETFEGGPSWITWIEKGGSTEEDVFATVRGFQVSPQFNPGPNQKKAPWKRNFSQLLQAFWLNENFYLGVFRTNKGLGFSTSYDPSDSVRTFAGVFSEDGKQVCQFDLSHKLREFQVAKDRLFWIETDENFSPKFKTATFNLKCQIADIEVWKKVSQSFERFSSLAYSPKYKEISLVYQTENQSDLFFLSTEKNNLFAVNLAAPVGPEIGHSFRLSDTRILTSFLGPFYFGPQILTWNKSKRVWQEALRVSGQVGGLRSVPTYSDSGEKGFQDFCSHWGGWRQDELSCFKYDSLSSVENEKGAAFVSSSTELLNEEPSSEGSNVPPKPYSRLSALIPEFWVPSVLATSTGYIFQGETFFYDYDQINIGRMGLGYESASQKPYVGLSYARKRLEWGPFHSLNLDFLYYSNAIRLSSTDQLLVQQRSGASIGLLSSVAWPLSGFKFENTLGFYWVQASEIDRISGFQYLAPTYSVSLGSRFGKKLRSQFYRLAESRTGFLLEGQVKFLKGIDLYSSFQGQFKVLGTSVFSYQTEFGYSDPLHFPAAYFEVTGLQTFQFNQPQFVSRGYPYRLTAVPKILRVGFEYGFELGRIFNFDFKWNRFGVTEVDLKFIYEATTFSTYQPGSYSLGKKYLDTVGAQLEFWGTSLHYVKFRMGTGIFYGLREFGDLRFALTLSSGLNL
jgi:hypothetical protein